MRRRSFIKGLAGIGISAIEGPDAIAAIFGKPKRKGIPLRRFGKTGRRVTEIGFGTLFSHEPGGIEALERAFELGINYIDTAASYGGGNTERLLKDFLKAHRKDVFLATKWSLRKETKAEDLLRSLDASLEKMGVDMVDLIQVHGASEEWAVSHPAVFEAVEKAKKQGKVRFNGVSTHSNQVRVVRAAIENKYDSVLVVYNFMSPPELTQALRDARKAGIAVVVMKALSPLGGRDREKAKEILGTDVNLYTAALKWVLEKDFVDTVIVSMRNEGHIRDALAACGVKLSEEEREALRRYAAFIDKSFCRLCGECDGVCPEGVSVAEVMRYRMYYREYGAVDYARALYRGLEGKSGVSCNLCGLCNSACPFGIDVAKAVKEADLLMG
jgi:predicted aldo/keto reductase-like oxidoreductase